MISEINIITDNRHEVKGYNNILYSDIENITNGFVSNIIFTTIDFLEYETKFKTLTSALKKIAYGGSLVLKFMNPVLLASQIKNGTIDSEKLSKIVADMKSMGFVEEISSIVSQHPDLKINKLYNDNIYTIMHIEKNDK